MLSLMESEAQEWGRNVTAAQYMVLYDVAYPAAQAYRIGLVSGLADNLSSAMQELGISSYPQVRFSESYYDQFLSVLSNPTIDGLLMLLGMILIALDFLHPTLIMSVLGGIVLLMGLTGAELIGASVLGLVLLAVSAGLLVLELKTGHGISLIASVAVGLAGIYLLGEGIQASPQPSYVQFYFVAAGMSAAAVLLAIYVRSIWGYRRRPPATGKESLLGKVGVVTRDLKPCGEVRVEGFTWRACSDGENVRRGEKVVVVGVDGLQLRVRRADTKG